MNAGRQKAATAGIGWLQLVLAVCVLAASGGFYRWLAYGLGLRNTNRIVLPVPLEKIPTKINGWIGQDIPIKKTVQKVAGNDDFINRLYLNQETQLWANVYLGYSARPRTMLGHRPEVCYVAGGWIHDGSESRKFITSRGRSIECIVHRFHKPQPDAEEVFVLNFYVLNGQITYDEGSFNGLPSRTPNIAGNPARYVAQMQIASARENSVLRAAADVTDILLEYLPDESGHVKAADYTEKGRVSF